MINKETIKKIIDEVYEEKLHKELKGKIYDLIDVDITKDLPVIQEVFNEMDGITNNTFKGLPLYSKNDLRKLNKNYYSVLNERCCIKVGEDSYILHSDIINSYRSSLPAVYL